MKLQSIWKATLINTLISTGMFAVIFALIWVAELLFPGLHLLKWEDAAWCVGIPASIVGVAYILSVKNHANYTGFYAGLLMSLLLGVQFLLQGNYDLTLLQFCIFIPFQISSIVHWKNGSAEGDGGDGPAFLSTRSMLLSLLIFVVVTLLDYLLVTFVLYHDGLCDAVPVKLSGALMISSSILANFWLIYKKNDSWIYWFVYSVSGIAFYVVVGNIFSIVLFSFYLVINSMAGIAWIKDTPSENYGWLRKSVS